MADWATDTLSSFTNAYDAGVVPEVDKSLRRGRVIQWARENKIFVEPMPVSDRTRQEMIRGAQRIAEVSGEAFLNPFGALTRVCVGPTVFFDEATEDFPTELMVANIALALVANVDQTKCINPGCNNRFSTRADFVGEYCRPCHNTLRMEVKVSGWLQPKSGASATASSKTTKRARSATTRSTLPRATSKSKSPVAL